MGKEYFVKFQLSSFRYLYVREFQRRGVELTNYTALFGKQDLLIICLALLSNTEPSK